jgi:SNARE associated Golgi protein
LHRRFWKGLLAVWAGGAVGQALAFLLARYLVRDCVVGYVSSKWERWEVVDKMIELEGWKLVLLLRLSPVVPYNLVKTVTPFNLSPVVYTPPPQSTSPGVGNAAVEPSKPSRPPLF